MRAVGCSANDSKESCSLYGDCVFLPMWEKAREALSEVYDSYTFQNLLEQEKLLRETHVPGYSI